MAITRTAITDDDGTGTSGTGLDNAWKTELYNQIDAADLLATAAGALTCQGRLTLTTAVPVTTADVTGATSIKWTPYAGNRIALYNGSTAWTVLTFVETSLALGTITAALPYDVFAYNNSGTLALELLAWTSATVRATALVLQDGVLVKSGATTRRYLGTFYTTSTTTTEDSAAKRYLWNYYNRVKRSLRAADAADSWTYTTLAFRQANANTANQVEVVIGWAEVLVDLELLAGAANSAVGNTFFVSIGEDSTTTAATGATMPMVRSAVAATEVAMLAKLRKYPAVGRHFYAWLEAGNATGTTTWAGDAGAPTFVQTGLSGSVEG